MKEENKLLKFVYTFFLGLLLAMFVGFGVNTFYEEPKAPEYPSSTMAIYGDKAPSEEQIAAEKAYNEEQIAYNESLKPYSRNVSIIVLLSAIALISLSLIYVSKIKILADGLMMGGLFTLMYSIIRSIISENSKYIFVTITVGLITVAYLGYRRFVHPELKVKK